MTINSIVTLYAAVMAEKAAAEKRASELKKLILAHAGTADHFQTDAYIVTIKETASERLDTKRLYADFPDIKAEYGRTTISRSVNVTEKTAADVMPA